MWKTSEAGLLRSAQQISNRAVPEKSCTFLSVPKTADLQTFFPVRAGSIPVPGYHVPYSTVPLLPVHIPDDIPVGSSSAQCHSSAKCFQYDAAGNYSVLLPVLSLIDKVPPAPSMYPHLTASNPCNPVSAAASESYTNPDNLSAGVSGFVRTQLLSFHTPSRLSKPLKQGSILFLGLRFFEWHPQDTAPFHRMTPYQNTGILPQLPSELRESSHLPPLYKFRMRHRESPPRCATYNNHKSCSFQISSQVFLYHNIIFRFCQKKQNASRILLLLRFFPDFSQIIRQMLP